MLTDSVSAVECRYRSRTAMCPCDCQRYGTVRYCHPITSLLHSNNRRAMDGARFLWFYA